MPAVTERTLPLRPAVWICGGLTLGLLATALVVFARCGASPLGAAAVWLAAFAGMYLPGAVLRSVLCPAAPHSLRMVLALCFGGGAFALLAVLASFTGWHILMPLWAVAGCLLYLWQLRQNGPPAPPHEDTPLLLVLWAGFVLLNALWAVRYAHPAAVGALIPSQDFFWNLGNTQSILQSFPVQDLRVAGVTVSYHFLTELLQAGLCMLTGLPAYDVVAFYGFAPVAAALVFGLHGLGRVLWASRLRALLLACMPLWLGCASLWKMLDAGASRFGNSMSLHVLSNINGQATALAALALFFAVFAALEKAAWQAPAGYWAAAVAGFYLLTFAKSPQAAILALALACAFAVRALASVFRGEYTVTPGLIALVVLVPMGFWAVYGLCFSAGADSSMALSLTGTVKLYFFASILNALQIKFSGLWPVLVPVLWLAQSLLMAPVAFCVWVGSALRDVTRLFRTGALRLVWHACIAGGLLAFYLFDHYSSSQIYFATLAVFCLGLVLLDRLPDFWIWLSLRVRPMARRIGGCVKLAVAGLAAAGCVSGLCLCIWLGASAPAYLSGTVEENAAKLPLTAQEEAACAWLAENMPRDALFATNRMHTGAALEGLSNVYSGLSGRHAYMESFKYAVSNMGDNAGDVMTRYDQMCLLFSEDTTEAQLKALCTECGISYLIYHESSPGSSARLACFERVYTSDVISIYKVS